MNVPENICVLRLSALGDVCNTVPVVRALQRARRDVKVTWIIDQTALPLVEDLPGVQFVTVRKRDGARAFFALRRAVAGMRFDALLHAQVSARANLLSLAVEADRRIGWDRQRSREGHGVIIRERVRAVPMQHQMLGLLEFARHLGAGGMVPERRLPLSESARVFARKYLPEKNRAVLISPCSSHPLRNWAAERCARLADWVISETGRPVVLIGGPSKIEYRVAREIESAMRAAPLNLVGKDTLKQSLAMLERAAVLIAPDSGPAHFAAAMGTPVVGLYAATWSRRSGPWGSLEHCVDRFDEAARRYLGQAPEELRWGTRIERPGVMELIKVDEVIGRLETLLKSR